MAKAIDKFYKWIVGSTSSYHTSTQPGASFSRALSKETLEFMRLSLDVHLVTVPAFERRGYGRESSR